MPAHTVTLYLGGQSSPIRDELNAAFRRRREPQRAARISLSWGKRYKKAASNLHGMWVNPRWRGHHLAPIYDCQNTPSDRWLAISLNRIEAVNLDFLSFWQHVCFYDLFNLRIPGIGIEPDSISVLPMEFACERRWYKGIATLNIAGAFF